MPEIKIIPQNDRLLVQPIIVDNTTKSGLIMAAGEENIKTAFATILAISESLVDIYKLDDIIFYNVKAGVQFRFAGRELLLLTKGEVLAIVEIDKKDLRDAIDNRDLA